MSDAPAIRWFHDEMLRPAFAEPGRPSLFVFDEARLREDRWSLKRVVFVYECLIELPGLTIRRGEPADVIAAFARAHKAGTIETAAAAHPRVRETGAELERRGFRINILGEPAFARLPEDVDLKRFSRYWRKAQKQVFEPSDAV